MILRQLTVKIFLIGILSLMLVCSVIVFKIYRQARVDEVFSKIEYADAIIVLGASQWDGKPSPVFQSRLDRAFNLYQNGYVSNIILTGGVGKGEVLSESLVGKNYLVEKGIEENVIYIEEKSHTSWQNLNQAKQVLENQNLNSVILVSDSFHMMRLKKMADCLGLNFYLSPVSNGPVNKNKFAEFKYVLRESVVYIIYLVFEV